MLDERATLDLRTLLSASSVASLATLRDGAPAVSLTPWAPATDGSAILIHVSRLAQHTGHMPADAPHAAALAEGEALTVAFQGGERAFVKTGGDLLNAGLDPRWSQFQPRNGPRRGAGGVRPAG